MVFNVAVTCKRCRRYVCSEVSNRFPTHPKLYPVIQVYKGGEGMSEGPHKTLRGHCEAPYPHGAAICSPQVPEAPFFHMTSSPSALHALLDDYTIKLKDHEYDQR